MDLQNPNRLINYFNIINEHTNQVFFAYNLSTGHIEYINGAIEPIIQKSKEEFIDNVSLLFQMIHAEDKEYIKATAQAIIRGENKENIKFRIVMANNSIKWINATLYLHLENNTVIGVAKDITKDAEYIFNLEKYASKKNSTLEILSHDLAGPLNTIQLLAGLLDKNTKQYNDSKLDVLLGHIKEVCVRGIDLIRDFVAQEFLESSNVELNKQRLNLVEKIGIIMDNYKIGEYNIPKTFNLGSSSTLIFAKVDDVKFMQAINNLISNSIKFTHDGGIINVYIEEKKDTVLISVKDDGIGIPLKMQEGLFEKFTKARRPGLKGEKSTGLGMSIIKTIVEWHGGKIWFKSEENIGTIFYIEIPKE